jgi:hypothetical protein
LYIYNAVGQVVLVENIKKGMHKVAINTNNLPNGIYNYKVVFEACGTKLGKFNIVHD